MVYYGAYEKHVLYLLRNVIEVMNYEQPVFWDVGANTDQHSLFMSECVSQVHAFEPYPRILARLHASISENSLSNIAVHEVGLGCEQSVVQFYEPPEGNLGTGSFVENFRSCNSVQPIPLPIVRADDYMRERGVPEVDVIKIDVEGYEWAVLDGMKDTLEMSRPVVEMELSVSPGKDHLFSDLSELAVVFPSNYKFLMFHTFDRRTG